MPQRELASATGFGYPNAGPYARGTRGLTGFLSTLPATWAGPTDRLGAFVGGHRPPIRVAGARAQRRTIENQGDYLAAWYPVGWSSFVLQQRGLPDITATRDGRLADNTSVS